MDIQPLLTRRNSRRRTDKRFSLNSKKKRRRPRKNLMNLTWRKSKSKRIKRMPKLTSRSMQWEMSGCFSARLLTCLTTIKPWEFGLPLLSKVPHKSHSRPWPNRCMLSPSTSQMLLLMTTLLESLETSKPLNRIITKTQTTKVSCKPLSLLPRLLPRTLNTSIRNSGLTQLRKLPWPKPRRTLNSQRKSELHNLIDW